MIQTIKSLFQSLKPKTKAEKKAIWARKLAKKMDDCFNSAVLPNTCANYGFYCDEPDCTYITQNEDDHIITDDGDYLCLQCAEKRGLK